MLLNKNLKIKNLWKVSQDRSLRLGDLGQEELVVKDGIYVCISSFS